MKFFSLRFLALLIMFGLLGGCASDKHTDTTQSEYDKIRKSIDKGEYSAAAYSLEQFKSEHPYSHLAIQSELLRIFAAYKGDEVILAETLSTRFIDRHPRHPSCKNT